MPHRYRPTEPQNHTLKAQLWTILLHKEGFAYAFCVAYPEERKTKRSNTGQAGFASHILALQTAGADVIVDDFIFFAEPMFQDGIIAQAVDTVEGMGVPYFSSAGNQARQSYESSFRAGPFFADGAFPSAPGAPRFFGGTAHDFDPGPDADVFQRITVPAGTRLTISFQWDSPFASVCPGCPGSPNDLDIYVFNDPLTTVLAGSTSDNIGRDAVEIFSIFNPPGSAVTVFNIMITQFDGPNPQLIKYVQFGGGNVTINEFNTRSSTLYGHNNAAGAAAVGAAFYSETPEFGVSPPLLEPFSSAGPTPILFNTAGNRLAIPQMRLKPEIVAPDGTNTTFFIPGRDVEPDGFPNFFGTSAAAPHAAAVAALLRQAFPTLSPAQVYTLLESTAIDMGPPGFDNDSGFGLIQADAALLLAAVPVDIKPQACRNPLHVAAQGVLPVAILGTTTFDVTRLNVATVRLEGVRPLRSAREDVATPFVPFIGKRNSFDCTTQGPDGFLDLTLKFDNQAVAAALGAVTDGEVRVLHLTGSLLPAFGGTPIAGEDVVVILQK